MVGIFKGCWCWDDAQAVFDDFEVSDEDQNFVKQILFANYDYECYEGDAHVVFIGQDGKLYEVNGSHCSCYGLEGQWDIEETSLEYFEELVSRGVEVDQDLIELLRGLYGK